MHHIEVVTRLQPAHLEQLPRLLEAATQADGHEPVGEHKFLRIHRGDDLSAAVLAFEGGAIVGYGHTLAYGQGDERRVSCEIVVHPDFRRRGVGRMLLAQAIQHAHAQRACRFDLWVYNDSPQTGRMVAGFGFVPVRRLLHLHRHVDSPERAPVVALIAGTTLRSVRAGVDDEAWLALNNRIFAGHPENGQWTLEDLRARMAQPWFCADDVLLLEFDEELAGFCWLKLEERPDEGRVGEIYVIGTLPKYAGRGLGRYLLDRGLARLSERDADLAAVYVDETNTRAVAMYESRGFHHHHVDVCYSRALGADAALVAEAAA